MSRNRENHDRPTSRVLHAAVWVADPEATLAFYVGLLGLERSDEAVIDGMHNYLLSGGGGAEIQFKHNPDRPPPDSGGVNHVAVAVGDVDAKFDGKS